MEWLERTELLLGRAKLDRLRQANVLIVALGGVGAYAAEMICRAGVGSMTIADADTVSASNINRQLLDKYGIEPGIPREEQSRQAEKAFRELDARLVRMTGRQSYADDLFESLRRKGPKPEKHASGVRQKEIDSTRKEQTGQPASGRRIKR